MTVDREMVAAHERDAQAERHLRELQVTLDEWLERAPAGVPMSVLVGVRRVRVVVAGEGARLVRLWD